MHSKHDDACISNLAKRRAEHMEHRTWALSMGGPQQMELGARCDISRGEGRNPFRDSSAAAQRSEHPDGPMQSIYGPLRGNSEVQLLQQNFCNSCR